jgi:two-component system nitrogen regulation sensor histidine kinase GlnL
LCGFPRWRAYCSVLGRIVTPFHGLDLLSTAVLVLDESLHVTHANPAAETLLAHGRKHLIGVALEKALPGNPEFLQRLRQSLASDAAFNENDVELDVAGERVHVQCVITPVEAGESRLVLELRELEQQLKIAREAKILEQQEANRELIRNLAHEIKNPLGGIRGAAQLLERELGEPDLREFTRASNRSTSTR